MYTIIVYGTVIGFSLYLPNVKEDFEKYQQVIFDLDEELDAMKICSDLCELLEDSTPNANCHVTA